MQKEERIMKHKENINKQYKDRLFRFIFGNPEHKEWTLALYNALNGTSYSDPGKIELNTLEDVIYMKMKNDISFVLSWELCLWEHQSSWNPNMPVRFLNYLSGIYEEILENGNSSRYGSTLIQLPAPRCIVFYNGLERDFSKKTLKLSDAFQRNAKTDVEVSVQVLNVNEGKNKSLLAKCKPLMEYSWLISRIRENQKTGTPLKKAINKALNEMPDNFAIKAELLSQKVSVEEMLLTEYNEKKELEKIGKEHFKKGLIEGKKMSNKKTIFRLFSSGFSNKEVQNLFDGDYSAKEILKMRKEWESSSN